jgi:tetratricopeptide (TPR) repeat protein
MMVDTQRAALALYEGHLETAVAEATKGAREGNRLATAVSQIHQGRALSIRAVALAALGRRDEALADVTKVRAAKYRQGAFVARAALAEALVFAREKNFDGLARVFHEDRALLFGATNPRERMIARALLRLPAAKRVSVYRQAAKRDEPELDEQASWVAQIAPYAASYSKSPKLGAPLEAPATVAPEVIARAETVARKPKRNWKSLTALWIMLFGTFLAIGLLLEPSSREGAPTADIALLPLTVALSMIALATVVVVFALDIRHARKRTVELSHATELRLRGDHDEARAAFERLSTDKMLLVAPQAERELATIATLAGDFRGARRHAAAGIASAHASLGSLALCRPILLPNLHAELAYAWAADGFRARAEEELEKLRTLSPSYPSLARDTFRVRLAGLVAKGRLDEATAMARQRPIDLPLSMADELLCDALRANAGDDLPEGERERIALDLQEDSVSSRFIDRLAPGLRWGVHTKKGPRVAVREPTTLADTAKVSNEASTHVEAVNLGRPTGLTFPTLP